jgi:hypothetical protein
MLQQRPSYWWYSEQIQLTPAVDSFSLYIETMWQTVGKVELNCEAIAVLCFIFPFSSSKKHAQTMISKVRCWGSDAEATKMLIFLRHIPKPAPQFIREHHSEKPRSGLKPCRSARPLFEGRNSESTSGPTRGGRNASRRGEYYELSMARTPDLQKWPKISPAWGSSIFASFWRLWMRGVTRFLLGRQNRRHQHLGKVYFGLENILRGWFRLKWGSHF